MALNKQEIFDKTYRHFIFNGGKPGWGGKYCIYGEPGSERRCAIGIHDDNGVLSKYQLGIYAVCTAPTTQNFVKSVFPNFDGSEGDIKFLDRLQKCHDFAAQDASKDISMFIKEISTNFNNMAAEFNLTIPTE